MTKWYYNALHKQANRPVQNTVIIINHNPCMTAPKYCVKARLHRRFLSRNPMQFLSRRSCIKFRTCSKLDATSGRQKLH